MILRLVALTDVPPGLHGDEAVTAQEAQRLLDEGPIGVWSPSIHGQPAGPFYWIAAWFLVLPETHFTVRLTTALLGILAVPVFYLFCREMFGRNTALAGAVALVFSYWAINFSRIAFPLASVPVVECAALYFLAVGVRLGSRWRMGIGGALAGATVYTYGSAPLFILALVVPAALLLWQHRRPAPVLRRTATHVAIAGIAAVVAASPFAAFALGNWDVFTGASNLLLITETEEFREQSLVSQAGTLLGRGGYALGIHFHSWHRDAVDAMGLRGLLDPLSAAGFAAGVAVALWKVRDWRYALLISGLLAGTVPAMFTSSSHLDGEVWGEFRRNIISLPFVMALAGVGGAWALSLPNYRDSAWGRAAKLAGWAVVATAVATIAVVNVHHYFFEWAEDDHTRWVFAQELVLAAEHVNELDAERPTVYLYSVRWGYWYSTADFLFGDLPGVDRSEEFGNFSLERLHDGDVVYVLMHKYLEHGPELMERYPGGTYITERDPEGELILAIYYLPG
ncbi:MAG: glycosyltransferase family 39 protein [Dehalococcoidia bacterium]